MAATTLYQSGAGVVETSSNAMLYDKTYDEIKALQDKVPKVNMQFVREESTELASYIEGEVSPELQLPYVSNDSEKILLVTPMFGHSKTITLVERRSGIAITRRAEETQKIRMLKTMMQGLPASMDRVLEYTIVDQLNSGTATHTCGDGSYNFAADHTKFDSTQSAWTNILTGSSFTTGAYFAAWQAMQKRTSERGVPSPKKITEIVYPVEAHQAVLTVLGSPKVAENVLNGINPFMGDAKPVMNVWLSSTTAWFAHDGSDKSTEGLVLVWGVRPNYAPISWSDNPDIIWGKRLRAVFGVGAVHMRNWARNAGA